MSIREQIAFLEELSAIDSEIRRIDEQLDKQRGSLEGMRSELKRLEDRLKGDRETLATIEKTRSELVIEFRQMSNQIERSREKLQRSRNERESNAAQREIEELRKLHRDREEEIERLNSAAEGARTAIDQAEAKRVELSGAIDGSAPGTQASLASLEAERAQRAEARQQVVSRLPVVLYRRYESIRTRRPVAIARTYDGTCLGCHLSVPPMMFQKMRRQEEFERCPHCARILYYMPPEAAPGSSPAADPSRA
ncbi:C4-type zinc ribbon domain-containing protein [Sorangium sp. So ce136]|uniref:zinc ribbon domain-containing protein n=1 Tax=Sorangium sp. So ce136 TaxID=3133284 RepID=UPI003EFD741B